MRRVVLFVRAIIRVHTRVNSHGKIERARESSSYLTRADGSVLEKFRRVVIGCPGAR